MKETHREFLIIVTIIVNMVCVINIVHAQNNNDIVKLSQIVLYYPDSVMEKRINVTDFSNYVKEVINCYKEYLLSKNNKNEASAIIVFAINQNHTVKIWLVDNYSNSNNIELNNLFMGIQTPSVNSGNIAAAIYIGNIGTLNVRIENNGIYIPDDWLKVINNSNGQSMSIDSILNIIFAQ
jgi:hypothetical protein